MEFVAGGPVGGSVSVDPSGIFVPGFFPTTPPTTVGGDALWDSVVTLFTSPGAYVGGTVYLVPEPTAGLLLLLGVLLAARRR